MAKMKAMGYIHQYNEDGVNTTKAVRVYATLCSGADPQTFEIQLDDAKNGDHRSLIITRDQIELVLLDNPY